MKSKTEEDVVIKAKMPKDFRENLERLKTKAVNAKTSVIQKTNKDSFFEECWIDSEFAQEYVFIDDPKHFNYAAGDYKSVSVLQIMVLENGRMIVELVYKDKLSD